MEQLRSILEKVALENLNNNSIYGLNQEAIQSKKLKNAKEVHVLADEEILLLHDNTLFGSAKDGMVFTDKAIYWREMLGEAQKLTYSEIVESTANENPVNKTIWVLDKEEAIQVKDNYYYLIYQLRLELIHSLTAYEAYYYSALDSFEQSFIQFAENKQFHKIIEWMHKYEGLFLKEEDKSVKIREVLFHAYLNEGEFSKAQKQLDILKEKSPEFYRRVAPLLESEIKEQEYSELEIERLKAIENEDFKQAYILFEQQIGLYIRQEAYLDKIELEIKEAHFKSLDKKRLESLARGEYETAQAILESQKKLKMRTSKQIEELANSMSQHKYTRLDKDRLKAIVNEEYHIAFFLLEKQRQLKVKKESEIDGIRDSMEGLKKRVLEKYHERLKVLIAHKSFVESKQMINQIHKIEPSYSLEREEILVMIYESKLEQAQASIALLSDALVKIELETILAKSTRKLYKKIRQGVSNKDYDYFRSTPDICNFKDEYGMSALHYFALEADVEGVAVVLEETNLAYIHANIFGHNFLDLLGLVCDPQFGAGKQNILDVLEGLNQKVNLRQIHSRIEFLKKGKEGPFFSYYLSQGFLEHLDKKEYSKIQEARLSALNKKLMSKNHFDEVFQEVKNQANKDEREIEWVIKEILAKELEGMDDYLRKDEFETSQGYQERCKKFIQEYLGGTDLLEEYKKQNQAMVEDITTILKRKNSGFISKIGYLVEYQDKGLQGLESVQTTEGLLELFNLYFPVKSPSVAIGNYDADKEVFYIIVGKRMKEIHVPRRIAKDFKNAFDNLDFSYHRFAKNGLVMDACIYEFQGHKIYFIDYIRGIS